MWVLLDSAPTFFDSINMPTINAILAVGSAAVTGYFWLIKANRERAGVRVYQPGKFKPFVRSVPQSDAPYVCRVWWDGTMYFANRSTLPTAVLSIDAEIEWEGKWLKGDHGWGEGGELPWNLPPLSVQTKKIAGFFKFEREVSHEEASKDHRIRFRFHTVEGKTYTKVVETNREVFVPHAE